MPQPYVQKMAKKHGVTVDKAEQKWAAAKKAAAAEGHGEDFAYVTGIFKKMMGETASGDMLQYFSDNRWLARLKERRQGETAADDALDTVNCDVPLFIRLLEVAREELKTDEALHNLVSKVLELSKTKDVLTMKDYPEIETTVPKTITEEPAKMKTQALSRLKEQAATVPEIRAVHNLFVRHNLPVCKPVMNMDQKGAMFELEQDFTPNMFKGAMNDMGLHEQPDGWFVPGVGVKVCLKDKDLIVVSKVEA